MKFSSELLAKAKEAKNAKELLALAEENGVKLTEEEGAKYFAELHREGEFADDELDNVSGGCGDDIPEPKYSVGKQATIGFAIFRIEEILYYDEHKGWRYKCRLITPGSPFNGEIEEHFESQFS